MEILGSAAKPGDFHNDLFFPQSVSRSAGSERLIWMEDSNTNQGINLYTLHTSKLSDTVILHNVVLIISQGAL